MGWPELLANPPANAELRYRTGHRRAEQGETFLVIKGSGQASLENRRDTETLRFAWALEASDVRAAFDALKSAGFPHAPVQTVPPGSGIIALEMTGAPDHPPVLLHRSFLRDLPDWTRAVRRLDDLCVRASCGAIRPG